MRTTESHRRLRTLFYDKVGLSDRIHVSVGEVTEKSRLQELLALKPVPVARLTDFCCRYKMPDQYRQVVWKLILNIVPRYAENCNFVREQRELMFWDAWSSLLAMRLEAIEWRLLEDTDKTSLLRLNNELRLKSKLYGVGVERNHNVVDNTDQCCTALHFVTTSSYLGQLSRIYSTYNMNKINLSPLSDTIASPSFDSFHSERLFTSPLSSNVVSPISNPIQRRNSCSADVGHYSRTQRKDALSPPFKESTHRKSGTSSTFGITSPLSKRLEESVLLKNQEDAALASEDELLLDANIYGVFVLKKHYIGYVQSPSYANEGWDYDTQEIATEEAVPSLVDNLLMWMISRDRICYHSYTWQIVNSPEMAAFLCIGRHLNCDAMEESCSLRCSVWDLISKNERKIVDSVLVTGRRMLGSHSSAVGQLLESVSFFDSPRLTYFALSLFSNLLSPVAAEKVLDKVIAECFDFLGYLFVEFVLQIRLNLATVKCRRHAMLLFSQMKHSDADCAVNTALEIFHKEPSK